MKYYQVDHFRDKTKRLSIRAIAPTALTRFIGIIRDNININE